ncbi:MAG: acyl-[acyl-carrier-protein]--UDP-N-acetylglucosamine O-acyltransferase, partial [Pseudomonadota bacterium]
LAACALDVIPFGMLNGNPGVLGGLNVVGMSRSGMDKAQIHKVRNVFKLVFHGAGTVRENLDEIRGQYEGDQVLADLFGFMDAESHRGLSSAAKSKRG